jgi:hypothetical protein
MSYYYLIEKLEIVKECGELHRAGRAAPEGETSFPYGVGKLRELVFAAAGGEMRSNYFQDSALIPSFYVFISAKFNKVAVWDLQKN